MNVLKNVIGGLIYTVILTVCLALFTNNASAVGLGISPSSIEFKHEIIRGTVINKTITLNRSETDSDIIFDIEKNFKPIVASNWITVNNDQPITLTKGENQNIFNILCEYF